MTINGAGAKSTIIQAGTTSPVGGNTCADCIDRVLYISDSSPIVNINDVTIRYGKSADSLDGAVSTSCDGEPGGGIFLGGYSTLTLNDCTVGYNRTDDAGDECAFYLPRLGNGGRGGGIYVYQSTLVLNNSHHSRKRDWSRWRWSC